MDISEEFIGYIEYHGELVDDGYLDAKKSAQALVGFDGALRHFIGLQNHDLKDIDYEIPVAIRKGSWFALIPDSIEKIVMLALATGASAYALTAAKKMAENDFKNIGLKEIFRGAIKAILWTIKIGKHLGELGQKKFIKILWKEGNELIGIPNSNMEYLFIPRRYFEIYLKTPPNILAAIASVICPGRLLRVGVRVNNQTEIEEINITDRTIFYGESSGSDILFPELEHGKKVVIEGAVTKGNRNTNTIGFRYQEHILTGIPHDGSIVRFKNSMFSWCSLEGTISRADEFGEICLKKPKLIFDKLTPIESQEEESTLFGDDYKA